MVLILGKAPGVKTKMLFSTSILHLWGNWRRKGVSLLLRKYLNLITWNPINIGKDALVLRGQSRHPLWGHTSSPKIPKRTPEENFSYILKEFYHWGHPINENIKALTGPSLILLLLSGLEGGTVPPGGHRPLLRGNHPGRAGNLHPRAKSSPLSVLYVLFTS